MVRRLWSRLVGHWIRGLGAGDVGAKLRKRRAPPIRLEVLESRVLLAAPVANNDLYSLTHDRVFSPSPFFGVLNNDLDADFDQLSASLVSGPSNGSILLNPNGGFTYTPNLHFVGTDTFQYAAFDGSQYSSPATVTLTVGNTAPTASSDQYTVMRDVFDSLLEAAPSLTSNDFDFDADSLTPVLVQGPTNGVLVLNADGSFRYTPNPNWFGVDAFMYRASDGVATSAPVSVALNVTSPFSAATNLGDVPVAGIQSYGDFSASLLTGETQVSVTAGRRTLTYNSITANPKPVIAIETQFSAPFVGGLPTSGAIPQGIEARLTFNGVVGAVVYFSTAELQNNDSLRFALQADAAALPTGLYSYTLKLVARYGAQTATREFSGTTVVVNRNSTKFGAGWSLADLDRLFTTSGGQLFVSGTGAALYFQSTGATSFASPAGPLAFSTLIKNGDGSYTLTSKTGEQQVFNSAGMLTKRIDLNGNTTTYTYVTNQPTAISKVTDPFGRITTFNYTAGIVSSVTDFAGRITTLSRDAAGRISGVTAPDPDGSGPGVAPVTIFGYDAANRITTITAPEARTTQLQYAFSGRLRTIVNPDGSVQQFAPRQTLGLVDAASGQGTQSTPATLYRDGQSFFILTNELNSQTLVRLDRFGNVISYKSPLGNTTLTTRDANGLPTQITLPDPDGGGPLAAPATTIQYDGRGNPTLITFADSSTQSLTFDATLNRPLTVTDQRGNTTSLAYDAKGNILSETNAAGKTTTYTYSAKGQLLSITQPNPDTGSTSGGPVTSFTYDTKNRVTKITNPDASTRTFTYDTSDNVLTATDELSRKVTYVYDALNRVTRTTYPVPATGLAAPVTLVAYDGANRVISTTDPLGQTTSYGYNARNWLTSIVAPDPDGASGVQTAPVVNYVYDVAGRRTSQSDPLGAITTFEYDADHRLVSVTSPDPDGPGGAAASVAVFVYDHLGRRIQSTDPLGHTTSVQYDSLNRVVSSVTPLGFQSTTTYDAAGNVLSIASPDPDGSGPLVPSVQSFAYDNLNRVISATDPRGNTTGYAYDHLSRLTSVTEADPDGAGALTSPVTLYAYNNRGFLTSTTNPLGFVTQYTVDAAGQVTKVTDPDPDGAGSAVSPVTSYTYDKLGRLVSVKDPLNRTTKFAYDAASQLTSFTDPLLNTTTYGYDAVGRTVSITEPDPDGAAPAGPLSAPVTSFAYDLAGRLTSRTNAIGDVAGWTYDALGRTVSQSDEMGRTTQFAYDLASRLVRTVDPALNATDYQYDADGRLTGVTTPDPDGSGPLASPFAGYAYLCTCQPPNHKKTQLFGISSLTSCSP